MLNSEITANQNIDRQPQKMNKVPVSLPEDKFTVRHMGVSTEKIDQMLKSLGFSSLDALIDATIPQAIRLNHPLKLSPGKSEIEALAQLQEIATSNLVYRSFIGMGYYNCITPPVIQRNILENPGWYTAYTPYQAEIAQGRLEALLNFQTMIIELTGLEIANASLLDEGTAAAEAMTMSYGISKSKAQIIMTSSPIGIKGDSFLCLFNTLVMLP